MISPVTRIFQIPQMFRPTVSTILAKTLGHINLERPADGLTSIAYWARFSRWCKLHPVARSGNGAQRRDRNWLYEHVVTQEGLESTPIRYLEFGVYRGESLFWWLKRVANPQSRFVGFDTFTGLPERWRATEPAGWFDAKGKIPDTKDRRCSSRSVSFRTPSVASSFATICRSAWSLIWMLTCSPRRCSC